jgi:hypothetical protein
VDFTSEHLHPMDLLTAVGLGDRGVNDFNMTCDISTSAIALDEWDNRLIGETFNELSALTVILFLSGHLDAGT